MEEPPKTASGIYLTPAEPVRNEMKIKITHIPQDAICEVGDTVIPIDQRNYKLKVADKEYVMLKKEEIVGLII